jgi:hypothetical protein
MGLALQKKAHMQQLAEMEAETGDDESKDAAAIKS